jgi:hypothetical protein
MAVKVDLPKELIIVALEQAASLRARNIKAATNTVIKEALEQEMAAIVKAKSTIETVK